MGISQYWARNTAELPEHWEYQPLAALVDEHRGISYGIVQPGNDDRLGVPVVRVNNLRDSRILTDNVMRVSQAIEAKYHRTRLRGGEVLLSLVGTLGEVAVVPPDLAGWNVARAVGVIPVRPEFGAEWVALCLRSPHIQHHILTRATTTVQATLNLHDVAELPIPLPPKAERDAIVDVIGVYDAKIELNRRMNATLEALARALFKSWFVDFDPVRAKAEGRQQAGMDAATAALFPDRFEDSALGEVPQGWQVTPLDELGRFLNGLALQKYPPQGGHDLPVIKIAQLRRGNSEGADRASAEIEADYIVNDGDLLFSWSGSLEVVLWCGGRGALNQHLFKVTSDDYPKWLVYQWIKHHLPDFQQIAAGKATTMGHIQRHHLTQALTVMPPEPLLKRISEVMAPLTDKLIANAVEVRTLAELRDTLLPKLMSGEVRAFH